MWMSENKNKNRNVNKKAKERRDPNFTNIATRKAILTRMQMKSTIEQSDISRSVGVESSRIE